MKILSATIVVVFLITFLATPTMGAGWFWDFGNAVGFAAFGGLLYLAITGSQRNDVQAHQALSYGVIILAVAHAFWFLLGDAAAIEFAKPGAPDYMWLGIVSLLLLGILMVVALLPDRLRLYKDYPAFRYWHRVIAVTAIASATYHIVASQFYIGTWYQALLLVLVAIAASFGSAYWTRIEQRSIATNIGYILVSVVLGALFVVVRNFPT